MRRYSNTSLFTNSAYEHLNDQCVFQTELFRQFGKVSKIVVSKRHGLNSATENEGQSTVGIYVTYNRKEDAAKAINGLDGTTKDGNVLRYAHLHMHVAPYNVEADRLS
jgi:hypothetical protein